MLREKVLRVLGYSTKCLWADLAVLFGLGCAGVGIGYGNMAVATGGVSISLSAAWFSIRENQQALLSQQPQRAIAPRDETGVSLDHSQQESLEQILDLCRNFYSRAHSQLPSNFQEKDVQVVLERLLRSTFPNSDIRREYPIPQPYSHSRFIDFMLVDEKFAIEVKVFSAQRGRNRLFDELAIDLEAYRHSEMRFRTLICFVYDPNNQLPNPRGFENHLRGDRGGFEVITIVAQNPLLD
ncbi:PD-(D/E)XK nuclease domain-containing protein [Thermosynechococcus sp. FA-CM-4201]